MRQVAPYAMTSLGVHVVFGVFLSVLLFLDPPQIAGSLGLSGARKTRVAFLIDTNSSSNSQAVQKPLETVAEKKVEKVIPAVKEGIVVEQPKKIVKQELPSEVKNQPREIDEKPLRDEIKTAQSSATQTESEESNGDYTDVPAGSQGQGGASDEIAENVGNSDRTNEMGIYLSILKARVQKNLITPFRLEKTLVAQLEILLATSGEPLEIKVLKSTGSRELDLLAINATRKALPVGQLSDQLRVQIPVTFRVKRI